MSKEGQRRHEKGWFEEESKKVGLRREDALWHSKWNVGVEEIAAGLM